MAGLAACEHLVQSGLNVVLLEANNYLGGRVRQIESNGWPPVDMGGEIIHGCLTRVYQLAEKYNWDKEMLFDYEAENGLEWIYLDGKMYPYHSSQPDILAAYTAWGDFVYNNKSDDTAKIDITAAEYFAKHPEINIKSQHIFDVVFCQTEAANLDSLGAQEHSDFQNGWECGPGNFRLNNSHKQVVQHYTKRCELKADIKLNWQAKEIDYSLETVTVTNQNGETLKTQAVIVCVPLTVLKDRDITFKPQLPQDKQIAIEKLQMYTGLKIVCRFREHFWPETTKLVFNCMSDISQLWMYAVVNEKTGDQCHVVTGFQTAEYARRKAHMTAEEVKEILLDDLNQMFGTKDKQTPATDFLIDHVYCHWSSNPYIRGAYSSPSVHARGSREILARPVLDRVFFAGEATRSRGDCATVSGALESGIKAAGEVRNALKL